MIDQINVSFLFFLNRFINARRRIVQPMIDQSNRAGKLRVNGSDRRPEPLPPTITKRYKHLNKSRGSSLNDRKLHRRTNPVKAPVISQQLPPLCLPKGKSVYRSNIFLISNASFSI